MVFALWDRIPVATPVGDLFTTSLLVLTGDPGTGVLVRCSAGLDGGGAVLVHATTRRPNSLRVFGVDADEPIGAQAEALGASQPMHVVAIPHITWTRPGDGKRWRPVATVLVAVLAGTVFALTVDTPLAAAGAVPVVAVTGLLSWLLLRGRIPTTLGPAGDLHPDVVTIVEHARAHMADLDVDPPGPSAEVKCPRPHMRRI